MAKTEATLLVRIRETGKSVLKSVRSGINAVGTAAVAVAGSMAALGAAGVMAVRKLGEFDGVKRSFKALAASQGQDAKEMLKNMRELSQGTVADLDLMKQANQALLLGLPVDRFGDMLKIAQSSAAATGESMDYMLNSIVTGLGRGSKLMLDNLGIVFKLEDAQAEYAASLGKTASQLTEAEKKQAFINKALAVGMENAKNAGATNLTLAQQVDKLSASLENKFNAALEAGRPLLVMFMESLDALFGSIEDNTGVNEFADYFQTAAKATVIAKTFFMDLFTVAGRTIGGIARSMWQLVTGNFKRAWTTAKTTFQDNWDQIASHGERVGEQLNNIEDRFAQARIERARKEADEKIQQKQREVEKKAEIDEEAFQNEMEREMERRQLELDAIGANNEQKLALEQKRLDMELAQAKAHEQKKALWQQKLDLQEKQRKLKLQKEDEKRQELATKGYGQFFQGLAALATSGNSKIAAIGRAGAIAKATMDAYTAINNALANVPYPANIAAAAGIGVQAFANVAAISGVKLAEGGIISPSVGGTPAIIGEAGRSEAVIPLPEDFDPDQGLGGGSMVINFNGPVMGDESQAREFALIIDEQLYNLRKNNESLSFDEGIV